MTALSPGSSECPDVGGTFSAAPPGETGRCSDAPEFLDALGLSAGGLRLLLRVLDPGSQPTAVSEDDAEQARPLLRLGLVTEDPNGRLHACASGHALRSYVDRLRAESDAAEALNRWLVDQGRLRTSPGIEQVAGADAVNAAFRTIQDRATRSVRALSIGSSATGDPVTVAPGTLDALARGVEFRVVYAAEVLTDAAVIKVVERCVQAGEQARVFPGIPLNLVITDGRTGFLMYPGPDRTRRALVITEGSLLERLDALVEVFWRMAVPMSSPATAAREAAAPNAENRQILAYLSAGLTDEAIAREVGVSERTIARRIARMQEMLGATGRFQLGVQAVRRGWL